MSFCMSVCVWVRFPSQRAPTLARVPVVEPRRSRRSLGPVRAALAPRLALGLALSVACAGGCDSATNAGPPQEATPSRELEPTGSLVARCFADTTWTADEYRDHARGLWLAESLANWTGLLTESERRDAPFFTDADWGTNQGRLVEGSANGTITFNVLDPWGADDDTDLEFMYLDAIAHADSALLSPLAIRAAWRAHVEPDSYVWVSNRAARALFDRTPTVLPPSTGLLVANDQSLMIDAQLTTELFGALAPGDVARALELAELPILTTASGYAVHAAQFYVALYALAPVLEPSLTGPARVSCLLDAARRVVPTTSKARAVIDLVLDAYAAGATWTEARDALAAAFQADDAAHGYRYLEWYESAVNLGGGVLALRYGEGALARTIQIGALSGWDSDNGTATMGGLLGWLRGDDAVREELAPLGLGTLASTYWIGRTRVGFDEDVVSFEAIAETMRAVTARDWEERGEDSTLAFDLRAPTSSALDAAQNPFTRWLARSALGAARAELGDRAGALVLEEGALDATTIDAAGSEPGDDALALVIDGLELDATGVDRRLAVRDESTLHTTELVVRYATFTGPRVALVLELGTTLALSGVRFVEGPTTASAGDFADLTIEVRRDGVWQTVATATPGSASLAFEILDVPFPTTRGDALRLAGTPRGGALYLAELDGLVAE